MCVDVCVLMCVCVCVCLRVSVVQVARMLLPFLQQRDEIGEKAKFIHRSLLQAALNSIGSALKVSVANLEEKFAADWKSIWVGP